MLVPLGVLLALRMVLAPVMAECRLKAQALPARGKLVNKLAAG